MSAVGLSSKHLSAARLLKLAVAQPERIFLALDNDASITTRMRMLADLRANCRRFRCDILQIPEDFKDVGEMPEDAIRNWIQKEQVL